MCSTGDPIFAAAFATDDFTQPFEKRQKSLGSVHSAIGREVSADSSSLAMMSSADEDESDEGEEDSKKKETPR